MGRSKRGKLIPAIFISVGAIIFAYFGLLLGPYLRYGLTSIYINPYKSFWKIEVLLPETIYAILLSLSVYALLIVYMFVQRMSSRLGEEHGSMKWRSLKDIAKRYTNKNSFKNRIVSKNVRLNEDMQANRRTLNMLVEGTLGTGKSRGLVIPNVLQLVKSGSSALIVDPKGEITANTGNVLSKAGIDVKVFDVKNMNKSYHYNPFDYIHSVKDAIEVVSLIWSATLGENKSEGNDPYWPGAAKAGLTAYVIFLWDKAVKEEQNFRTVFELFNNDAPPDTGKSITGMIFEKLRAEEPTHPALFYYDTMHNGTPDMQRSVRAVFSERLKYFTLPEVLDLTNNDEMDFNGMIEKQTVIFCIIPSLSDAFNFLVSLLFMQMVHELFLIADNKYKSKLPRHIHLLIDEFYSFSVDKPLFLKFLSQDRGYNISCTMIIQTYNQLVDIYKKEGAETIDAYCDEYLFLGSNSTSSTKHVAEMLGSETIETMSYGFQHGGKGGMSSNRQLIKRELLDANELRILNENKLVFFLRNEYPVLDDKYDLYSHPYSKWLGERTGKYYDHGEADIGFPLFYSEEPFGDEICLDVELTGTNARYIHHFTDDDVNIFL